MPEMKQELDKSDECIQKLKTLLESMKAKFKENEDKLKKSLEIKNFEI